MPCFLRRRRRASMTPGRANRWIVAGVIISASGVAAWILYCLAVREAMTETSAAEHRLAMDAAWKEYLSEADNINGLVALQNEEALTRFQYHRDELVRLGILARRTYVFRHIQGTTGDARKFLRLIQAKKCPPSIYWESPHRPGALQLILWCEMRNAQVWDRFVATHDVPIEMRPFFEPMDA